jgi:hypothetical protein
MSLILGFFPGIKTSQIDRVTAEVAANMSTRHPDYERLASRFHL